MLIGHLALPTILKQYFDLKPLPLYAGSVAPDVVDKGLQQMGLTVNGRNWAHNIFALITSTTAIWLIKDKSTAKSWFIGYLGHLLCDSNGFVPWLHPLATYEFHPSEKNIWQKLKTARLGSLELIFIFWAIVVLFIKQMKAPK